MFTRARLPGLWILGSVISPAELEHIDDYFGALDSAGGTYSLGAALILGGAGVTLSGTSHHVAGTLTVDSLGLIKVANGGEVRADGTSGDIKLQVVSGVAKLTAQANTILSLAGAVDLESTGVLTVKASAGVVVAAGGEVLVQASGVVQTDSNSDVNVSGRLTVKAATGVLKLENGTANTNLGKIQHGSTSENAYTSGATETGTVTDSRATARTGLTTFSGSGGRRANRSATLLPDSSSDVTVADDTVRLRQTMTGIHVYTLRHTGTVPTAGERIHAYRSGTTTPSAHSATFAREDSTVVFTFHASKQGFADFEFDGSDWQLVGWAQFSSADASGSYGDVW